jgi:ubiquinone/menaquinone biosynthesis C-methylase UbiE/DNA-binding transcriptional ArsR family regulator
MRITAGFRMTLAPPDALESLLVGLRAAADASRLRLLAICAQGEWTVSELTQVMGQSQPRISRHLKLLADAGLLERFREGSWVFYRRARSGAGARLARNLCRMLPADDPDLALDRQRLAAVRAARQEQAARYFAAQAGHWDEVRSLYVDEAKVETALLGVLGERPPRNLLDIGTGTGRILQLFAPRIGFGLGIDLSREMLSVARANLDRISLRNCQVRLGDMYHLPLPDGSFEAATMHNVLHFADDPGAALAEAARVLRPGGRLVVVDFARHELEFLRREHAHRRLGFTDAEMHGWFNIAGLVAEPPVRLAGEALTVVVWPARRGATGGVEDSSEPLERSAVA